MTKGQPAYKAPQPAPRNAARNERGRHDHEDAQRVNRQSCCASLMSNTCRLMKKHPYLIGTLVALGIIALCVDLPNRKESFISGTPASASGVSTGNHRVTEVFSEVNEDSVVSSLSDAREKAENTEQPKKQRPSKVKQKGQKIEKPVSQEIAAPEPVHEADQAAEQERQEIKELISRKVGFSDDAIKIYQSKGYDQKNDQQILIDVIMELATSSDLTLSCRIRNVLEDPSFRIEIASVLEISATQMSSTTEYGRNAVYSLLDHSVQVSIGFFHLLENDLSILQTALTNTPVTHGSSVSFLPHISTLEHTLKHEFQHAFLTRQNLRLGLDPRIFIHDRNAPKVLCKPIAIFPGEMDCTDLNKALRVIEKRINTLFRLLRNPGSSRTSDEISLLMRYQKALQSYTPSIVEIARIRSQIDPSLYTTKGNSLIKIKKDVHIQLHGRLYQVLHAKIHPHDPKLVIMRLCTFGNDAALADFQRNLAYAGGSGYGGDFAFPAPKMTFETDAIIAEFLGTSVYKVLFEELDQIHFERSDESYKQCVSGLGIGLFSRKTVEEVSPEDTYTAQPK